MTTITDASTKRCELGLASVRVHSILLHVSRLHDNFSGKMNLHPHNFSWMLRISTKADELLTMTMKPK